MEDIVPRIGTFFILIAIGLMILFVASDLARQPAFDYFFLALIIFTVGVLFRRRAAPRPPSGRFGLLRRMREARKQEEQQKQEKK